MTRKDVCPGCGRRCDLRSPSCDQGREFAQSGGFPERARGEDVNNELIIHLRDISHMMRMQYEGKASQKRILIILRESGGMTQKALTERLGIQPGSASEILSKLENAGLISRTQNGADRRTTDIQLTDVGAELALEAAGQRQKRHEEMFSCLTEEEKTTLLRLLEKVRTDWERCLVKPHAYGFHNHHRGHGGHGDRHHGGHFHHGE